MPPLPNVPNVARVRVFQHIGEHEVENIYHAHWNAGVAASMDMQDLAVAVAAQYIASFATNTTMSSEWVLDRVTAEDLTSASGAFYETAEYNDTGGASQKTHAQSAIVISWPVARRFRGGHYRTYIAGLSDDQNADAWNWTTGAGSGHDNVQTFANDLPTAIAGAAYPNISGVSICGVSYYNGTDPVTHKPIRRVTPLVDFFGPPGVSARMRSQRRRTRPTPAGVL